MSGRLTDEERRWRKMSGGELQAQIHDVAEILGWVWMAVGPLRTAHGWRTATRGPLGQGWPDDFLLHPRHQRIVFAEVKREIGDPVTDDQARVHAILRSAGLEVHVVRPSTFDALIEVLRQ